MGLLLATVALLLAASLISYHPADPSFLHQLPGDDTQARNWIGSVGAEVAALVFGLVGLAGLAIPVLLWVPAWRRLSRRDLERIRGRAVGALLLVLALPVFLQLLFGEVWWRGAPLDAGGVLGRLLVEAMVVRLNFIGSFLVSLAILAAGISLLTQASIGEVAGGWVERLHGRIERTVTLVARWRQRRQREKLRRRVVAKHLRRREEEAEALIEDLDLPLRVEEREGEKHFALRRVQAGAAARVERKAPAPAERKRKRAPSQPLLFAEMAGDGPLPPLNLLMVDPVESAVEEKELIRLGEVIRHSCAQFGVEGSIEGICPGPVITVFEFKPAPGVKVSQIVNLQDDLALALRAESVRIDRIPGRSTLGIEVPNQDRAIIRLGHLLDQERFRRSPSVLTMAIGMTLRGEPFYADLATMPHLLVAGATGSGKSVGLQSMVTSILYKAHREEVQFIFIDPKRIELGVYADIPHLKTEVVVEPKKAANALRWAVAEMERRYRLLAELHVRSIEYYNRAIDDPQVQKRLSLDEDSQLEPADLKPLPYYVVVIDELADLMMVASAEVEGSIARLTQMARAVGIHLIVATQRPSVDVLTGTIKANFPCRISYATASRHDSRTILDQVGAEQLLGRGDMLFMPPGTSRVQRLHGAYISEQETAALIRWLKKQGKPNLDLEVVRYTEQQTETGGDGPGEDDELYDEAARLVVSEGRASASFLQRRMRIGFSRAARLIDMMEQDGLLGPPQGSKSRDILVRADYFEEIDAARESG